MRKKCVGLVLLMMAFGVFAACANPVSSMFGKEPEAVIKYKNPFFLVRAPRFEGDGKHVTMKLNGMEMYFADVVTDEEMAEKTDGLLLLSESDNMKCFRLAEPYETDEVRPIPIEYAYVLDLDGTDDYFVYFEANQPPGISAMDFTTGISYWFGNKETVPEFPPEYEGQDIGVL